MRKPDVPRSGEGDEARLRMLHQNVAHLRAAAHQQGEARRRESGFEQHFGELRPR